MLMKEQQYIIKNIKEYEEKFYRTKHVDMITSTRSSLPEIFCKKNCSKQKKVSKWELKFP